MEDLEARGGGNANVLHANECSNPTSIITDLVSISEDDKRRSSVWQEFLVIDGASFTDGKKRAKCSHCKTSTFIASSNYGTSNMRKHLEKCKAYQATKNASQGGQKRFEQKVYRDLLAKAIIKHGYGFSWVEHEQIGKFTHT